jgi:hypothetical protein
MLKIKHVVLKNDQNISFLENRQYFFSKKWPKAPKILIKTLSPVQRPFYHKNV